MSKNRNYNKKQHKKQEKLQNRKKTVTTVVSLIVITVVLTVTMLVLVSMPTNVKFRLVDGKYVDPKTGNKFVSLTPLVYEPYAVYDSKEKMYGTMENDPVYEMQYVSTESWLARELADGIMTVYCREGTEVPTLSEYEANKLYVCTDGSVVSVNAEISEEKSVQSVVAEITEGSPCAKPEGITKRYTLRFHSEEYKWLYFCIGYAVTENGGYYMSLETNEYYPASDTIEKALSGNEAEGDA